MLRVYAYQGCSTCKNAVKWLKHHGVAFTEHVYAYVEHGGTAESARQLGWPEHAVVKTLVMQNERAEPLIVPKRSLTNSAQERVDVRVLQLIYALPETNGGFRVGQQVDAFIPARKDGK